MFSAEPLYTKCAVYCFDVPMCDLQPPCIVPMLFTMVNRVDLHIPIDGIVVHFRKLKNLVKKMEEEIRQLRSAASKETQRRKKNKIPCTIS